jgi:hypothetical protein
MIRFFRKNGQPSEDFCHPHEQRAALERIISAGTRIAVSRTEPPHASRESEYASVPQALLKLKQLSELTSLCHDPPPCVFSRSLCALKLTAALHHHRQLADRHSFKNARRSTGGRSGSCSRRICLRGNNDRRRSDRGHETHNAYL